MARTTNTAVKANSVRLPTERQLEMRSRILSAARNLLTERGYEGVTMRDLADVSGVALKTLYYQYKNKEYLLQTAIEERFISVYRQIDSVEMETGIGRLFYIIDTVGEMTLAEEPYAQASASLLGWSRGRSSSLLGNIRQSTYRRAIQQIADEGELVSWAEIGLLTSMIYTQMLAVYRSWTYGQLPLKVVPELAKLAACLSLASISTGRTHQTALETAELLAARHKNRTFL